MNKRRKMVAICLIGFLTLVLIGVKVKSNACGVGDETGGIEDAPIVDIPVQQPEKTTYTPVESTYKPWNTTKEPTKAPTNKPCDWNTTKEPTKAPTYKPWDATQTSTYKPCDTTQRPTETSTYKPCDTTQRPTETSTYQPVQGEVTQEPTYQPTSGEVIQDQPQITAEPEQPNVVETPEENNIPEETSTSEEKENLDNSPKTADDSIIYYAVIVLIVSGISAIGLYSRKKMNR